MQNQITDFTFVRESHPIQFRVLLVPHPPITFLNLNCLRMKKLNTFLHKPDVQGAILISCIVLAIAVVTFFTWGK